MTTYRFTVEVDDDMRGQVESKPWTAWVVTPDGQPAATLEAGISEAPWEALAELQVDWNRVEQRP